MAAALADRRAGAPISWGVCEVPGWGAVLPAAEVLADMRAAGLHATELGPPGYLPADPEQLRAILAANELRLVGGFVALILHDPDRLDDALAEAARMSALLAAGGAEVLVLAAASGLDGYDERPVLDDAGWRHLATAVDRITAIAADRGVRTALHPHVGTMVETAAEVDRLLRVSTVQLCLDTGHLLIGGVDPLALAREHADRIGHVHLKDVDAGIADRVRRGELTYTAGVHAGLYRPLGDGDVPVADIVSALESAGYMGWYVLEQDTALDTAGPAQRLRPRHDIARSLDFLARATH
jgi:inosose dehydratase